jgi:Peptidase family C25
VRHYAARTLVALSLLVPLGWYGGGLLGSPQTPEPLLWSGAHRAAAIHTAFLAGQMSENETLQFTAALAASGHPGPVLFDSANSTKFSRAFLAADRIENLITVGSFNGEKTRRAVAQVEIPRGAAQSETVPQLGVPVAAEFNTVTSLQESLFPQARRVVVAPGDDRRLVLHAACLAGVLKAPLLLKSNHQNQTELILTLAAWEPQEVYAIGDTISLLDNLRGQVPLVTLSDEQAVTTAYLEQQLKNGPIKTIVLANPEDVNNGCEKMSTLAPWIALQKRAALVLTNSKGTDAEDAINAALKKPGLAKADVLIIAADLKAIPMPTRPNPMEGGRDTEIEMEPMTPTADKPCSFAVGRIFHQDRNVVALMLARQRLLAQEKSPKALIVSNPGGGLPLLETFSRNTANEFKNAGFDTTAYFGRSANKADVKRKLPDATVFLWEGHASTLISSYAIHQWQEPLKPSLIFLQSCLALSEPKAQPFLERGALGVIGSSTRTYSGSGGAFALAFFDTLLYDDQPLGGSLRQAKNFMLAFAELKKRRFGEASKLGGANIRSAWAFTLWGDPTVQLPHPEVPDGALAPVHHVVKGNDIIVTLPAEVHDEITSAKYLAVVPANARLAGLVRKQDMLDQHKLVPFTFAEVNLPQAVPGKTPKVHTKLPETHWVFCYDDRCQRGYLLVTPRTSDHGELRFHLVWE